MSETDLTIDLPQIIKNPIFGLHGEFSVGKGSRKLRAIYLETKIRPGSEGTWDNILASHLKPWREIFDVEKVTFDELLQRDLNDSRVAHDLIPYLIGDGGSDARFFPPILVVLVPKNQNGSGIESYYPECTENNAHLSFGELFNFSPMGNAASSPFGRVDFNPQRTAFIIVDGQHRAMAVLALHRQITKSWSNSTFESYYKHIEVTPEMVSKIELPVCIVFFPELTETNSTLSSLGLSLDKACRELFLVVNKKAQQVSQTRNLLLDDEDFGARMMRRTLSSLKGRTESKDTLARIYSFRYGDSDEQQGKNVQSGQLEYSSAVFLHTLQCIGAFGNPKGFTMVDPADLSNGLNYRNSARPANILLGTDLKHWQKLSRDTAKAHDPKEVAEAVDLLGGLNDIPILSLFDEFLPFATHNRTMRQLQTTLFGLKSDPIQNRCLTLLFEGSGAKDVFDEHVKRLENLEEDLKQEKKPINDYIKNQLKDGRDVQQALQRHERDIRRQRACQLFNLRYEKFYSNSPDVTPTADQKHIESRSRSIFDAVSTQAFQIGYLASVITLVQYRLPNDADYNLRIKFTEQATGLVVAALNAFFDPGTTRHETLTGLITESRINVFSTSELGLRGLLGLSIHEINERQWPFFRYCIYEILASKAARKATINWLNSLPEPDRSQWAETLMRVANESLAIRSDYIRKGQQKALDADDFEAKLRDRRIELQTQKAEADHIEGEIQKLRDDEKKRVEGLARENIVASTGAMNTFETLSTELKAFLPAAGSSG